MNLDTKEIHERVKKTKSKTENEINFLKLDGHKQELEEGANQISERN